MRRFLNPLLLFAAHSRRAGLIRQIQYLKVENEILRRHLPKRLNLTPQERTRLTRYARRVGKAIFHLVSIVSVMTMRRWLRGYNLPKGKRPRKLGRPRTPQEIEAFILRVARETSWGYTRILGELKKLGIRCVSRTTVVHPEEEWT